MSERKEQTGINLYALQSLGYWETFFFIQTGQVGVGLFTLPRVLSEEAGHSGWMALFIEGGVAFAATWLMILLLRRFPDHDLYGILRLMFGKWVGNLLGLGFALYCLLVAVIVCRTYVESVQAWLFPTTSTPFFYLLLLVPIFYCASGGARVLGRFGLITFFSTIWMMLFLIVPGKQIVLDYYLPIFDTNFAGLLKASMRGFASFAGFELILIIYPYIQDRKKAFSAAGGAIWFTVLIYLLITLVCFGFYSEGQLQTILSPTLKLFQIVQLPIIERIEHIGIAVWSFLIISTAVFYVWSAGRYLAYWSLFEHPNRIYWLFPLILVFGFWPKDFYALGRFENWVGLSGSILSLGVAPVLLALSYLLRKKGDPDTTKSGATE